MSLASDERKFGEWTVTNSQLVYPSGMDKTLWGFVELDVTNFGRSLKTIVFWGKPGKKLCFHVKKNSYTHYRKLRKYKWNNQFRTCSNFCTWKSSLLHYRPDTDNPSFTLPGFSTALFDDLIAQIDKRIIWETLKD